MRTLRILVAVGVVSAAVLVTALPAAAAGQEVIRTGNPGERLLNPCPAGGEPSGASP